LFSTSRIAYQMSSRIVKNVGSGLISQAWTAALGLFALPILVRGLGAENYGLLSLSLALIGFAAIADLGVGRAASKFIAEDYERNELSRTQNFVSTALTVSTTMGVVGSLLLLLLSSVLASHTFDIRVGKRSEAEAAFALTAVGLVPVLLRILFDGVLAGHHHIAFLSLTNMLANTLKIGLSVAAILTGYSLLTIITVNVIVCYVQAGILCYFTHRVFAGRIKIRFGWEHGTARQLLGLGLVSMLSWILANVIFLYADRFIIGLFFPLALIGYYTMAFDISSKQWYISNSISQAFFPVFSGKAATFDSELERSYLHASKATAVLATGVTTLLIVFGRELLTFWISPEFAVNGGAALMVLACGILLSAYISTPYTAIIAGAARPSICVKIFAVAIVLHLGLSLWWLHIWGIVGVALAFVAAYLFVFVASSWWVSKFMIKIPLLRLWWECYVVSWIAGSVSGAICWFVVRPMLHGLLSVAFAFIVGYCFYLGLCAVFAYDASEREQAFGIARGFLSFSPREPLSVVQDGQ
jgi:O-antigen/teichoic acid export membrane protein